jgi:hypothetical protein
MSAIDNVLICIDQRIKFERAIDLLQKVEQLFDSNFPSFHFSAPVKLIFTDYYVEDVDNFIRKNGLKDSLISGLRGTVSLYKALECEGETSIFFTAPPEGVSRRYVCDIVLSGVLHESVEMKKIATLVTYDKTNKLSTILKEGFKNFTKNWIEFFRIRTIVEELFKRIAKEVEEVQELPFVSVAGMRDDGSFDVTINNFRRAVRSSHYNYADTLDNAKLHYSVATSISNLVYEAIPKFCYDGNLEQFKEFREVLLPIMSFIEQGADATLHNKEYDCLELFSLMKPFYEICSLRSLDSNGVPQTYMPTSDAKLVFKVNCVETSPGIVAFIDILGFKEYISEHDIDEKTDNLRSIKFALDTAMSSLKSFEIAAGQTYPNVSDQASAIVFDAYVKMLADAQEIFGDEFPSFDNVTKDTFSMKLEDTFEYRMFSDNLCLSSLYIGSEQFLGELLKLLFLSANYQYIMMHEGFYVRGGISDGGYYSDSHLIFSDALVKSYEIESSVAIYPRVVIHENIIEKLLSLSAIDSQMMTLLKNPLIWDKLLVRDKETDLIFLNPFIGLDIPEYNLIPSQFKDTDKILHKIQDARIRFNLEERKSNKYVWLENFFLWHAKFNESSSFSYFNPFVQLSAS